MEHRPVLRAEVLDFLAGGEASLMLDATVGLGGHAHAFLKALGHRRLVGIDRDADVLAEARKRLAEFGDRVRLDHAAFGDIDAVLDGQPIDAVLFDLGANSVQFDTPERGFSFRHDGPLDMRMDQSQRVTAADLVNRLSEKDLGNLLYELGGERSSRRVAASICTERRREPIRTTGRLANIVRRAVRGRSRIDAATRTFQALRMEVNDEIGQLEAGLEAATRNLRPGGRILVIAFHSGEDRIVKHFLRADERLDVLTKKVIKPAHEEISSNPRARSARLRCAERRAAVA